MFLFEQFPVYKSSEEVIRSLQPILRKSKINPSMRDQLYRSSSSILLNIAEGAGKTSKRDKRNFYSIARGSTQETVAILRLLVLEGNIDKENFDSLYMRLTEISKMLSGLINAMERR